MRILIAHNVPGRASGGMTRIMSFLHEGLRQAGHTIEYLCAEDLPAQWNGSKARFGFPYLVHRHTSQAARVGKPYDIINVHEPSGALVSWWKSVRRPGRIVVTSHGIEERGWQIHLAERRKHGASVPIKSRVLYPSTVLWQARLALRKADHVFCLNTQDRNYLIEHLGRKPDSITRIYPGAAPVYVPVARNRCYAAATRWLFAGTWNERKGVRYFSESFTRLAAEHPQVSLCVLGAGVPQDEVRSYFPEALRSRVSTVQTTSDEENARVLANSDVYVLPSLFEGTPLTLMEAMMSGLPVITTSVCGMRDVIKHEVNGLLVEPGSVSDLLAAMQRLLADAEGRARVGRQATSDALTNYTWPAVARIVEQAYFNLLQARN